MSTRSRSKSQTRMSPDKTKSKSSGDKTPESVLENIKSLDKITKKLLKLNSLASVIALIFVAGVVFLAYNNYVRFYPKVMRPELLKGFTSRAEYALRYQVLQLFWLLCNSFFIIYGNHVVEKLDNTSSQDKTKSPGEKEIKERVKGLRLILVNSFEQCFISFFAQLTFVSFAQPDLILKLIPVINIIQFFGRIAFFAGYPHYRSFGATLTLAPNTALVLYGGYRLGAFVRLY